MVKKVFKALFYTLVALFLLSLLVIVLYRYVPIRYTPLMAIRKVEYKRKKKT